jgi:hypothetical protein
VMEGLICVAVAVFAYLLWKVFVDWPKHKD